MQFSIDTHLIHYVPSNCAIAGNTIIRSVFGAAFPAFGEYSPIMIYPTGAADARLLPYMYSGLGIRWSIAVLGFIASAPIPVAFLLFTYGAQVRKWSRCGPKLGCGGPGRPPPMAAGPMEGGPPVMENPPVYDSGPGS